MEVYNIDDQSKIVKSWMKKNLPTIAVGIVLGLILVYGVQFWRGKQAEKSYEASNTYEILLNMVQTQDEANTVLYANHIVSNYPKTPYASMAQFFLTKDAVAKGDLNAALDHLNWVIKNTNVKSFRQIARVRAGRILLSQGNYEGALKVLDKVDDKGYTVLIYEIRGDIYHAMKNNDEAKKAYETAIKNASDDNVLKPIIVMKLNSLALIQDQGALS